MHKYSSRQLGQNPVWTGKTCTNKPRQIVFEGFDDLDIYNPSFPVSFNGRQVIAARVEPRENHDSKIVLFENSGKSRWRPVPLWNEFPLEDPFFFNYKGELLLGGVETFKFPAENGLGWRTVLFRLYPDYSVEKIFSGPNGMKDLRFIELPDGKVGVFTRPQGGPAGRGSCGYLEADSIREVTNDGILSAQLISRPDENSWEGVNQPILLDDSRIGLLGHIAWMGAGEVRHYYAAVSLFFRFKREKTAWKVIIRRSELPPGPSKRDDLTDVLFPGGMTFISDKEVNVYLGVSDAQAWEWRIPNPFNTAM